MLTSLPLLRKVVEVSSTLFSNLTDFSRVPDLLRRLLSRFQDLEHAQASDESHASFYFTKESHIHTFVNLVLASGLPMEKKKIPELDYGEDLTSSF